MTTGFAAEDPVAFVSTWTWNCMRVYGACDATSMYAERWALPRLTPALCRPNTLGDHAHNPLENSPGSHWLASVVRFAQRVGILALPGTTSDGSRARSRSRGNRKSTTGPDGEVSGATPDELGRSGLIAAL